MIKNILIALLLIAEISPVYSQFNPKGAEKSLVKVVVNANGKMGVCSGFLWKKKSWVVTSLHAMKAGGKIQIVYPGNAIREAKVIRVLAEADLVLLETTIDANPITNEVVALSGFQQAPVVFDEKIYAIGYNGGSKGNQTQKLEKGHAEVETLEFLVRAEDKASLSSLGIPSMKLPIYFLQGSLLPGFSGCPVFNQKNELIGIGDGGLERGTMNVSWCIPAANLVNLEASSVSELPAKLGNSSHLYSAEVSIDVGQDNTDASAETIQQKLDDEYGSFKHGEFEFYQTKTRTFEEMKRTSWDAENMNNFADDFEQNNFKIGYEDLNFDIYEEINNGFVLAIPEGTELEYNEKYKLFIVNLDSFPDGDYFELEYYMVNHNGTPVDDVINEISGDYGGDVKGLTIDTKYTKSYQLGKEWKVDYVSLDGDSAYNEEGLGIVSNSFYLNIISNDKVAFYSLAVIYIPQDRKDINKAFDNGIDCINNYKDNADCCEYFSSLMQIVAAAHLTGKSFLE